MPETQITSAADAAHVAARLLGWNPSEVTVSPLPETLGWSAAPEARGAGTLLVASDGSVLFVASSQRSDPIEEFRSGVRTRPDLFPGGEPGEER